MFRYFFFPKAENSSLGRLLERNHLLCKLQPYSMFGPRIEARAASVSSNCVTAAIRWNQTIAVICCLAPSPITLKRRTMWTV